MWVRWWPGRTRRHSAYLAGSEPLDSEPAAGLARVAASARHMDLPERSRQAEPTSLRNTTLNHQSRIENELSWILARLEYTTQ
jgi:hypothetical protein